MSWTIRAAREEDIEELNRLYEQVDRLHWEHLPERFRPAPGPARDREYLLKRMTGDDSGLFVVEWEGRLAGAVHVIISQAMDFPLFVPRRFAIVNDLVVDEKMRGRGVGMALMDSAGRWGYERGASEIELNVYEFNQGAIELYRRLGYQTVSRKMVKRLGKLES